MTSSPAAAARRRYPRAALFDLDGTLIDSVPDITMAVGELMATEGLAPFDEEAVRDMIGLGLQVLVRRAFAARGIELDADALGRMAQRMRDIYPRHLTAHTTLLPGAIECLDALAAEGCAIALVTNKMQAAANTVLGHFGIADRFGVVLGDQMRPPGFRPKPSPEMLEFALARLGVEASEAIMIGDSAADVQSAAAAGVFSVVVRNGYGSAPLEALGAGVLIDDLTALPLAIEAWRRA